MAVGCVSISDEKPLHMRLGGDQPAVLTPHSRFNLRREAAPHATQAHPHSQVRQAQSFNLRREAAPHATQCDCGAYMSHSIVSISDEKPLHMRQPQE